MLTISDVDVSYCTGCSWVAGGHNMEVQSLSVDGEYTLPVAAEISPTVRRYEYTFSSDYFMTARQYEYSAIGACDVFESDIWWDSMALQIDVTCATGEISFMEATVGSTSDSPIRYVFSPDLTSAKFLGDELSNGLGCPIFAAASPVIAEGGTVVAELAS